MPTTTVSTRLEPEELKLLESLSEITGFDRSTLVKSLLRRGMKELRRDQAIEAFRREKITLSRAAELAGMELWDFLGQMDAENLELHYEAEEFESDMKTLAKRR